MVVDAVVLAGSPNNGYLRSCSQEANEALIPVGKRPIVDYVVEALLATPEIGRLAVVGPVQELGALYFSHPRIVVAPGGDSPITTFLHGLEALEQEGQPLSRWVLVITSDLPLITPQAISYFLQACQEREGDLYYPVVTKEVSEQRYPGVKRTYVTLKEGTFTGGNLMLVNPRVVASCLPKAQEFVRLRKSPLALSRLIGWKFIIKFLLKRLSLWETESQVSSLLGIRGVCIISPHPEVGVDVDKPSDLELVRRVLLGDAG